MNFVDIFTTKIIIKALRINLIKLDSDWFLVNQNLFGSFAR